jgi:2-iminobutanoate/2-iminopropanoate deaminase
VADQSGVSPVSSDVEILDYDPPRRWAAASRVGNIVYLAGETGVDPDTMQAVPGGIEAQTEQACRNMATTLARFGMDLSHVVKLTMFMTDISMLPASGAARARHFPRTLPSSAIGVRELAHPDLLIEIEGIAVIPDQSA